MPDPLHARPRGEQSNKYAAQHVGDEDRPALVLDEVNGLQGESRKGGEAARKPTHPKPASQGWFARSTIYITGKYTDQ